MLSPDWPRQNGGVDDVPSENSGTHKKPDPVPEEKPINTQRDTTAIHMVSCNGCSPPPTDPSSPILLHGHQPCQVLCRVSQETHFHLELGAHQNPVMPPDKHRRLAVYSLDYICLPVCLSHYL